MTLTNIEPQPDRNKRTTPIGGDWTKEGREAKRYANLEKERKALKDEQVKLSQKTAVEKDIAGYKTVMAQDRADLANKERALSEAKKEAHDAEKEAKRAKYETTRRYRAKQWIEKKGAEWEQGKEIRTENHEIAAQRRAAREERESARAAHRHEAEMQKIERKRARTELRQLRQESHRSHSSGSYDYPDDSGYDTDIEPEPPIRSAPKSNRPKSTPKNKPKSRTTTKPKSVKAKPKGKSKSSPKASKPRSMGKDKSKPKTTQKKKRSPPKKGKGGMWEYGGGGLFD